jgi:hypothetical protein
MSKRSRCRHDRLRGIYGDEIRHVGWKRSECLDCGRLFDELPKTRDERTVAKLAVEQGVGPVGDLSRLRMGMASDQEIDDMFAAIHKGEA